MLFNIIFIAIPIISQTIQNQCAMATCHLLAAAFFIRGAVSASISTGYDSEQQFTQIDFMNTRRIESLTPTTATTATTAIFLEQIESLFEELDDEKNKTADQFEKVIMAEINNQSRS